jgi:hypothetical protein
MDLRLGPRHLDFLARHRGATEDIRQPYRDKDATKTTQSRDQLVAALELLMVSYSSVAELSSGTVRPPETVISGATLMDEY